MRPGHHPGFSKIGDILSTRNMQALSDAANAANASIRTPGVIDSRGAYTGHSAKIQEFPKLYKITQPLKYHESSKLDIPYAMGRAASLYINQETGVKYYTPAGSEEKLFYARGYYNDDGYYRVPYFKSGDTAQVESTELGLEIIDTPPLITLAWTAEPTTYNGVKVTFIQHAKTPVYDAHFWGVDDFGDGGYVGAGASCLVHMPTLTVLFLSPTLVGIPAADVAYDETEYKLTKERKTFLTFAVQNSKQPTQETIVTFEACNTEAPSTTT